MSTLSRLSEDGLLENPSRQLLLDLVTNQPGLSFTELRRATNLASGACQYHLYVLIRSKRIMAIRSGRHVRHYQSASTSWPAAREAACLALPLRRAIWTATRRDPAASAASLSTQFGVSRQTISYHLRLLRGAVRASAASTWPYMGDRKPYGPATS